MAIGHESPPLVSVVIPVYNQGEFVTHAIESALAQRYAPMELIVVDDGSTDETPERLLAFEGHFSILRQPNRGAAAALNRGIRASHGAFVCWLSADDVFLDGKLEAQVAALRANPAVGMVHTGYDVIDAQGTLRATVDAPEGAHPDPFVTVFWTNSINGSTVMLRREVFDACGGFDESLRADVDGDMWLRIAQRYPILGIPGVFVRYRVHGNSLSANPELMKSSMTAVRRRFLGELRRRVERVPGTAAALFAVMSGDFAAQGLDELAGELLKLSRGAGRSTRPQLLAAAAIKLARIGRRPVIGAFARPLWRVVHLLRDRRVFR